MLANKTHFMYRELSKGLKETVNKSKDVMLLFGARQVGKTTLLKGVFPDAHYLSMDDKSFSDVFNHRNLKEIEALFKRLGKKKDKQIIILDEAQLLVDPGRIAKLIHDELPEYKLILTGSSALELANKASESLAGRKKRFHLYPLSLKEKFTQQAKKNLNEHDLRAEYLEVMTYGLMPGILNREDKEDYLIEYVDSVLFKDIFYLDLVREVKNLKALLKLLAYQIGNLVNINDLSSRLGISRVTVERYIRILKGVFVIYTLPPYRKNRRDEIGKSEKVYFYDLGVRNALINDFSPPEYRRDFGALFENFIINERMKLNAYRKERFSFYFWRTTRGSEVDLVLEKDGKLQGIEVKVRKGTITRAFTNTYPEAKTEVIQMKNCANFIDLSAFSLKS
jgi:predicted AAA+ superfamily ATPase